MSTLPGFLYFGRLTTEKGFDIILDVIDKILSQGHKLPFEVFIFGTGPQETRLLSLTQKTDRIHFFGRQSLETIKRYLPNCQYVLMPSRFLETFGLSALNALARELPVIGFRKGGLTPFIVPELDITHQTGENDIEKLLHLMTNPPTIDKLPDISEYTKAHRKTKIQSYLGEHKHVLLVSDFSNKVGGIETYIWEVKSILEELHIKVDIIGNYLPQGICGTAKKYLGMIIGLGNIFFSRKLLRIIKKEKPTLIRYHSMLRRNGRLPIKLATPHVQEQRMIYHDLGYIAPFPHAITEESQLSKTISFKHFLHAPGVSKLNMPLVIGKRILTKLLQKTLKKHIKHHFVPSQRMLPYIKNAEVLEHFVQE